jgi:class 3 adenylate cyclase/pimeloyl-ACP methyl ester carboxylesterase
MALAPDTRYARDGDVVLAYQVAGSGDLDLLYVPTATFPIDLMWDEPMLSRSLRRLTSFGRVIATDLLGSGSSDVVSTAEMPAMQAWSDGFLAVLDAAGSEQPAIFAAGESALPAMLFAASYPQRVRALVLWAPYAYYPRTAGRPWGMPEAALERYLSTFVDSVGTGAIVEVLAPTCSEDSAFRRWWARSERLSMGPGSFGRILETFLRTDVRGVLGSIQAPTLVLRREGDAHVRSGHAQEVAAGIHGARLVELPGDDHTWFAQGADAAIDEIESFLTGERVGTVTNRVLSTVLFTDIVDSTKRAAAMGDGPWVATLEEHNRTVGRYVASFRGRVVQYMGDGMLATFDGPARAIECALEMQDALHALDLEIRAGLHTGEVEVAGDDLRGIAVHIAARIMSLAAAGQVLVSGAVPPLVLGSGIRFEDRGSHTLKGVPDEWPVFAVVE